MIGLLTVVAATEESQGIAALGIDPLAILAQTVTFLILFWVIKKFALNKIVNTLEERRKTINKGVLLGIKMEKEKEAFDSQVEQMLHKARIEGDRIIAQSNTEAGSIIQQAQTTASRKADEIIIEAHNRIDEDIKRAKKELRTEMVELVSSATETIIKEKVTSQKDKQLIERSLEEVRS